MPHGLDTKISARLSLSKLPIGPNVKQSALTDEIANLEGGDLSKSKLHKADLQLISAKDAIFCDAIFIGADLTDAEMGGSNLKGATLTSIKFGTSVNWRWTNVILPDGTRFQGNKDILRFIELPPF